jgi:hypothetical protein
MEKKQLLKLYQIIKKRRQLKKEWALFKINMEKTYH